MRTMTIATVALSLFALAACETETEHAVPMTEHTEGQHMEGHDNHADNGVMIGEDGDTKGVRIGGENGVMIGKDGDTKGVQIGGEKGLTIGKEE